MGVLNCEMVPGLKVLVEGHLTPGDLTSPYVNSKGIILERPSVHAKMVHVKLFDGPHKKDEELNVPICCIYWRNQKD